MAPETIKKQSYNSGIDWWSFGVTVYESSVGERLVQGGTQEEIYGIILNSKFDLSKLKDINNDIYDMCTKLLRSDTKSRLGVEDINSLKQHAYFEGINWDSISTEEMKFHPPPFQPPRKSAAALQKDRRNIYGEEDPERSDHQNKSAKHETEDEYSSARRTTVRKKYSRKGISKNSVGWNSQNSLSVLVINERSNEVSNEESIED